MAWVRLSDDFYDHPKFDRVGPLGIALFAAGLAWCNRNLTDGFIPRRTAMRLLDFADVVDTVSNADHNGVTNVTDSDALTLAIARDTVRKLVDAGLWTEGEDGFWVHDYLDYQASKTQIETSRQSNAARQKAWRERRKTEKQTQKSNTVTNGTVTGAPNPNPNPKEEVLRTSSAAEDAANADADHHHEPPKGKPSEQKKNNKKATKKATKEPTVEEQHAQSLTKSFFERYGRHYSQPFVAIRKITLTALCNGVDRDNLARALDVMGHERRSVTGASLQFALQQVYDRRADASPTPQARDAPRCSAHRMPLPCHGCLGEIKAGDREVPRRLLAEHGAQARPDLAEHLDHLGVSA